jgi:hypothetical protein
VLVKMKNWRKLDRPRWPNAIKLFLSKKKIKQLGWRRVIVGITARSEQRISQSETSLDIRICGRTNIYGAWQWSLNNRWREQVKSSDVNRYLPDWTYWWPGRIRLIAEIREKSTATTSKAEGKASMKESNTA